MSHYQRGLDKRLSIPKHQRHRVIGGVYPQLSNYNKYIQQQGKGTKSAFKQPRKTGEKLKMLQKSIDEVELGDAKVSLGEDPKPQIYKTIDK
mmetsp:Transcript_16391/g.25335  ORF Transcript_16391/g.25335 Transcript_16391/m.25335 type:complete len:92 (+) Transcript_16391:889-1164(+)